MKLPIYDYFPMLINKCDSEVMTFVLQQFEMTSVCPLHWKKNHKWLQRNDELHIEINVKLSTETEMVFSLLKIKVLHDATEEPFLSKCDPGAQNQS